MDLTSQITYLSLLLFSSPEPLAHGELLWSLDIRDASSTIVSKGISSYTSGWILTKLSRNGPYIAVHCIFRSHRLMIDFQDENIFFSETTMSIAFVCSIT